MSNLVILIGYRGVGKTTVGEKLAKSLGYEFIDTDEAIVKQKNAEVIDIVANEGWEGFRQSEKKLLASLAQYKNSVISTGGGAVLHLREWQSLRDHSIIIWLTADPQVIIQRLKRDSVSIGQRPPLTGDDVSCEVSRVLQERIPLYQKLAHHQVDTGKMQVDDAVAEIQRIVQLNKGE